ncbi:MAG: hypothetical protein LH630_05035 [Actinomycetia bacterium]|nr:hypothetical protein [Actinomycetes bacterium]
MAVATYEDVGVALGRPISSNAEQEQINYWLGGVELLIMTRLGSLALLNQAVLRYVETEAVVAKVRRSGTAESSITVAVDDGSVTRRYENAVSSSDISEEWWNLLDPDSSTGTASIRPGFEPDFAQWSVSTPPAYDPGWDAFR